MMKIPTIVKHKRSPLFTAVFILLNIITMLQNISLAQSHQDKLLRVYEDNDFINILGHGSDRWYSHGFRLDFFYGRATRAPLLPLFPVSPKRINTYSWGIAQMLITPSDLSKSIPDAWDYPYASSLFITRSVHSTSREDKLSVQSEMSLGVLGPASMAEEVQVYVHKQIGDELPMGWSTQWDNDLLLNYNISVEKEVLSINRWFELMIGGRLAVGSLLTGTAIYSVVRIGKMNSYFDGFIAQFSSNKTDDKWQAYLTVVPSVEYSARNAYLVGGLFQRHELSGLPTREPKTLLFNLSYGFFISSGDVCISFTQKSFSPLIVGLPRHAVGNISFYIKL